MRISDWSSDVCSSDLTDVVLCVFPPPSMRGLIEVDAEIARKMAHLMYCQAAAGDDHLTNVGARSALERLAWFLLDLRDRLEQRSMIEGDSCPIPLTQSDRRSTRLNSSH